MGEYSVFLKKVLEILSLAVGGIVRPFVLQFFDRFVA